MDAASAIKANCDRRHGRETLISDGKRGNRALARENLRDQHQMIGVKDDSFVLIWQTWKQTLLQ